MQTNQVNKPEDVNVSSDLLKHILCGALTQLDALSLAIRKLDIKERIEDNDPKSYERARMMHLTMIAINDIIHPAHKHLYEYFKGTDSYFDGLVKSWNKAKSDGLVCRGCMCDTCAIDPRTDAKEFPKKDV